MSGLEFNGETSREWATEHRFDEPIRPGSDEYSQVLVAISQCKEEYARRERLGEFEGLREIQQNYSRLLWQIAPIWRVPEDVLILIFSHESLAASSGNPAQLINIVLTCSRWAEVAQDVPFLWSDIGFGQEDPIYMRNQLWWPKGRIRTWLTNSRKVPLDIDLLFMPWMHSKHELEYFTPLVKEFQRWKSLRLNGTDGLTKISRNLDRVGVRRGVDAPAPDAIPSINNRKYNFHMLERLEMLHVAWSSYRTEHSEAKRFLHHEFQAPNLHTLILSGTSRIGIATYAALVEATPNVRDLMLGVDWYVGDGGQDALVFGHPKVENLTVHSRNSISLGTERFLAATIFPRLLRESNTLKTVDFVSSLDPSSVLSGLCVGVDAYRNSIGGLKPTVTTLRVTMEFRAPVTFVRDISRFPNLASLFPNVEEITVSCRWPRSEEIRNPVVGHVVTLSLLLLATTLPRLRSLSMIALPFDGAAFLHTVSTPPFLVPKGEEGNPKYRFGQTNPDIDHQRIKNVRLFLQPTAILYSEDRNGPITQRDSSEISRGAFLELVKQQLPHIDFHLGTVGEVPIWSGSS